MPGLYRTAEGRAIAYASYDTVMGLWPVPYEDAWVETSYGRTHIITSGPANGRPIILLPGLFADATMWYATVGPLAERYRVYAVDCIGYAGKSEPSGKPASTVGDYEAWFSELLSGLGIESCALAGLSYGGWLTIAMAKAYPGRIEAAVLLDPAETFAKLKAEFGWRGMWTFTFFPSRAKTLAFFSWIGGDFSSPDIDLWSGHLLDCVENGSIGVGSYPSPLLYKAEDLAGIRMPILALIAGKPVIYASPEKVAASVRALLPQAEAEIVPDTAHSLQMEKPELVNARIQAFLDTAYPSLKD